MENLKGKKIANLYHESSYGKETIPVLNKQSEMYGFEIRHYPVPHPGLDQKATWLEIARRYKPDWVILRGWGVMNPTALKEASRVGFPADRIVGVWWSGAEEDVIPAGKAAVGYIAAGFHPSGADFPVIQEILDKVHGVGKGAISPQRVGTIYYNRGLIAAILSVEAIRVAQGKFGNQPLTGEQVRWGIENLDISAERIKELGAEGSDVAAQGHLRRPRGRRCGQVPAVERNELGRGQRLDRDRQVDRRSDDPGLLRAVRRGEGHHAALRHVDGQRLRLTGGERNWRDSLRRTTRPWRRTGHPC